MRSSDENESVITMTEPQIWTMIGAVIALMFGMVTVVSTLFIRVLRAEIGGVRSEIGGLHTEMVARFEAVDARFEAVDARFVAVNTRIDAVETRIEGLDRDVRALVKHTFGLDRG
jgi:hypothetical protein